MEKKKILLAGILIYAIFAIMVIISFNAVSKNPIDDISIPYIRNNTNIQKEYGDIISVGRNVLYETQKDEFIIKAPYTIETETGRIIAYVTLEKGDKEWNASSIEIIEVILNEREN